MKRPAGSNADEWRLFLSHYLDSRATSVDGLSFVAVQIAEAIEDERSDRVSRFEELAQLLAKECPLRELLGSVRDTEGEK